MKCIRVQGERIDLGRVQVDFSPEWIPDPNSPNDARGEKATDSEIRRIAVPRARIFVKGSDKVIEIRDLERIQRLRRVMKRSEPIAMTNPR